MSDNTTEPATEIAVPLVTCRSCNEKAPLGTNHCPACSSALPGNSIARKHGYFARRRVPDVIKQEVEAQRAGIISDLGGESELTTLESSYVDKLGVIETGIKLLVADIAQYGLITRRVEKDPTTGKKITLGGQVRTDVYDRLLTSLAAFDRYAVRLGLQRRAKRVQSLQEIMGEVVDGDE